MSLGRATILCGVLISLIVVEGCRQEQKWQLTPVEGAVTHAGRPLAGAEVVYWPEPGTSAPRASSFTDAAGRYKLQTDAGNRGAAAGNYRVCILVHRVDEANKEPVVTTNSASHRAEKGIAPIAIPQAGSDHHSSENAISIPPAYGSFDKTPLRAEIRPRGVQTIDFNIP